MDPHNCSPLDVELLFLITKFLESGPCKLSARVLKQELVKKKILPKRLDWEGSEHEQSFNELEQKFPHIRPTHLLEICTRIGPILDREIKPNVSGLATLLGAGRQSLLRTAKDVEKLWMHIVEYSVRFNQRALYSPVSVTNHNIVKVLRGRENSGPLPRNYAISNHMYSKTQLLCSTLGHLSAVYCLLFDHTGKYVITGADDLLVKVWSAIDGRLLASLRGASAEISDIAINTENTLLAAGSIDRLIRIWCLQTAAPVAILTAHGGMITGVNFCPGLVDGRSYLASTSSDGSVAIWLYSSQQNSVTFTPKPIQFIERTRPGNAQMISAAFSSGGMFLAAGSADHYVRVYKLPGPAGPQRVLETEAHTDRVDSIQWAHYSLRFVSGSKDGTAIIWQYRQQEWKPIKLSMTSKLPRQNTTAEEDEAKQKLKVTMVSWDCRDKWVVTACSDFTLKVWDSFTGTLLQVLSSHKDEVYVLEGHPLDSQIFMSAGHDGLILLWDIVTGKNIASFQNNIENQGHGAVFDAKWSPDGTMLAATDSHGQILMFGLGSKPAKMLQLPKELFFHTDYRPLIRDNNQVVLDEQTQVPPHQMPPPFLVDVDGNPYPPHLQRLVPGRENCTTEQLVPNIILNQEGQQEVIQDVEEARSNINQMIQALAHQVNHEPPPQQPQLLSPRSRSGARREGDVEGVRQSRGNWQRDEIRWTQRVMVQPLDKASLQQSRAVIEYMGELELQDYTRESLKPKEEVPRPPVSKPAEKKQQKKRSHAYRTRAVREQQLQDQFEDPNDLELSESEVNNSSQDSTACSDNLDSGSTSSSESASSEYSDWIKDEGEVLEPPKRRSKRIPRSAPKPTRKSEEVKEVPDGYKPSDWLSAVIPKKFPYYPQMGDEIMFFKEGYQLYLDAVSHRKIYQLTPTQLNPCAKINIKEPELVKVVGIRYEVRPPHLCCLRLAVMKRNGQLTGDCFTIKYHDIPDVIDFFVLRQTYDNALDRKWEIGDRFKSMIDDHWWWGRIDGRRLTKSSSEFLKYRIVWDNGETEFMSPWDMEIAEQTAEPVVKGESIPVSVEEITAVLYRPRPDEWPLGDRDAACERIIMGLEQIMELSFAEPFIAPVDLNRYPSYATVVEYPIDLSTIKARFENRFYRRITAAQFDIRYLATNTEKFNEAHSYIVKQARIVTDLCLKIVKETCTVDVSSLYRQLLESYRSEESEEEAQPGPSTSRHRQKAAAARSMRASRREASRQSGPFDWKRECRELLEMLWACRDSEPFREPLDRLEHPDYYRMVDTPMDLGTMREELRGNNYESPEDFCDDLRRIFTNSKNYSTDKRSRVYTMAVRLSALAEQNMKRILNTYHNLNKKGSRKKHRPSRRKILMSDEENASVSEYEPPTTKRVVRTKKKSDGEGSVDDSDGDYRPSTALNSVFNGHPKKRKVTSRHGKTWKNGDKEVALNGLKNRNTNHVENTNFNGPSTSKAVINNIPITKRAKMIHVEKKSSSSSDEDDDSSLKKNLLKKVNHNVQVRIKKFKPFSSDSEESKSKDGVSRGISKEMNNEEEMSNDSEDKLSVDSDGHSLEVSEKPSSSDSNLKIKPVVLNQIGKKTVKCIFPKRIIQDTDSENSKENLVNKQNSSSIVTISKINGQTKSRNKPILKKGKYPLRQRLKKNLAEASSEESNEEDTSHYKTRRSNQRLVNGSNSYAEQSDSDDDTSDEEESENVEEDDEEEDNSCNYTSRKSVRNGRRKEKEQDENFDEENEDSEDNIGKPSITSRIDKQSKENDDENFEEEEEDNDDDDESDNYVPRPSVSRRNRKQIIENEDDDFEEDSDNYIPRPSINSRTRNRKSNVAYDNFDDEDEESDNYVPRPSVNSRNRKRRRSSDSAKRTPATSGSDYGPKRKSLRSRKSKTVHENLSDSNDSDSDLKPAISISSRGRIRKLTPRARALQGVNL